MSADADMSYSANTPVSGQLEAARQEELAVRYRARESDCLFSHTVVLPEGSIIQGGTDLRGTEEAHLGGCDVTGKRVLEFGGGSGWLTSYLAIRAREVVTLDMPPGREELSEPLAGFNGDAGLEALRAAQERVRKGWWLVKERTGHTGKMVYCDLQSPPGDLGTFDVAVMPSTLLHLPLPFMALRAAAQCTTECIAVTEPVVPDLQQEGPMAVFAPNLGTGSPNHWWHHSAAAISRMLLVVGFGHASMSVMVAPHSSVPLLTVTGRKPGD